MYKLLNIVMIILGTFALTLCGFVFVGKGLLGVFDVENALRATGNILLLAVSVANLLKLKE